jgi:hypothetical protein
MSSRFELVIAVQSHLKRNLGPLIRTSTVFGVSLLVIVGPKRYGTHGAHGSDQRLRIVHFFTWEEAHTFLTSRCPKCLFYEICESPRPEPATVTSSSVSALSDAHLDIANGETLSIQAISPSGSADHRKNAKHTKSIKLERCAFPALHETFPASAGELVIATFCLGPQKGWLDEGTVALIKAQPLHVEFPVPRIMEKLKFENMFSIVLDHFVTRVVNTEANKAAGLFVSTAVFKDEKFYVCEAIKNLTSKETKSHFLEHVADVKMARRKADEERQRLADMEEDFFIDNMFA